MKTIILFLICCCFMLFSACGRNDELDDFVQYFPAQQETPFINEGYELVSLVLRLAGIQNFNNTETEYQQNLALAFERYRNHPAVVEVQRLSFAGLSYAEIASIGVNLLARGHRFFLQEDHSLASNGWTDEVAIQFVGYLNDFYTQVGFAEFFTGNIDYYMSHSTRFYDVVYRTLNLEWFMQFGLTQMQIIISPSMTEGSIGLQGVCNYSGDMIVYVVVPSTSYFNEDFHRYIIYEFSRFAGVSLAYEWYEKDQLFRHHADIAPMRSFLSLSGVDIAKEYVARAIAILYMVENKNHSPILLLQQEMYLGLPYIEHVFAKLADDYEVRLNSIGGILATEYELGEAQYINHGGENDLRWHAVNLFGYELDLSNFFLFTGMSIFDTQTGDVLYVHLDGDRLLFIDIGCGYEEIGLRGLRLYSMFVIDEP